MKLIAVSITASFYCKYTRCRIEYFRYILQFKLLNKNINFSITLKFGIPIENTHKCRMKQTKIQWTRFPTIVYINLLNKITKQLQQIVWMQKKATLTILLKKKTVLKIMCAANYLHCCSTKQMHKYNICMQSAHICLFIFLAELAKQTFILLLVAHF